MKTEKVEKFFSNFHDKTEYVIHIRKLMQTLIKSWISFKKFIE